MKIKVIAGDYKNWDVLYTHDKMYFMHRMKKVLIDKSSVDKWELIDDIEKNSLWSHAIGAGIGGLMFGTVGAVVGAVMSGNKSNTYLVSIEFLSGKKSLLQLDDDGYKNLIKCLF